MRRGELIAPAQLDDGAVYKQNTSAELHGHTILFPAVRDPEDIFDEIGGGDDPLADAAGLTLPFDPEEVKTEAQLYAGSSLYSSARINPDIRTELISCGECITLASIGCNRTNPGQDLIHIQENRSRGAVVLAVLDGHEELGKETAKVVSNDFWRYFAAGLPSERALCAVFPGGAPEQISQEFNSLRRKQTFDGKPGGATWVSVEIVGGTASLLSAGDSWAAIFRRQPDDSLKMLVETRRENEYFSSLRGDGRSAGRRNVLLNSLLPGEYSVQERLCRYDPVSLETGDIVLLASDGIDALYPSRVMQLLTLGLSLSDTASALGNDLRGISQGAPSMDDASLVLFRYDAERITTSS
jgi:serine/threonine protein phosphatase PrpC